MALGEPSAITGSFAFQGGKQITNGYLRMSPIGGNPLKQNIEIWMTPQNSTHPIENYGVEMTKKLHVVVVSKDFVNFSHIHPVLGRDGIFRIDQQFPAQGVYYLYADGEPNDGDHQVFRFTLTVGTPGVEKPPDLTVMPGMKVMVGPYTVSLSKGMLTSEGTDMIEVKILKGGSPAKDLHPYLGVPGHAVFLNSRDLSYVHVHPTQMGAMGNMAGMNMGGMNMSGMNMGKMTAGQMQKMTPDMPDSASSPPDMMLYVSVKEQGIYKLWLQFRGGTQLYVAPFVLMANP
jgi:hypothetical protein